MGADKLQSQARMCGILFSVFPLSLFKETRPEQNLEVRAGVKTAAAFLEKESLADGIIFELRK